MTDTAGGRDDQAEAGSGSGRRTGGRREQDLHPVRFPGLSWREGDLGDSLEAVYQWVEGEMVRAAGWYLREKRSKSRWSRGLRVAAVAFATAGAILPFVAANTDSVGFQWGYVCLALAAGAVALDRFFGFSTAWMRYMATEVAIQQELKDLQFEWATMLIERGAQPVTPDEAATVLANLAAAAGRLGDQIARETVAWADEFQSNIGELRSLATQTPT